MTVILEFAPEQEARFQIDAEDRHSVRGYGTAYLKRVLNMKTITLDDETVYEDLGETGPRLSHPTV